MSEMLVLYDPLLLSVHRMAKYQKKRPLVQSHPGLLLFPLSQLAVQMKKPPCKHLKSMVPGVRGTGPGCKRHRDLRRARAGLSQSLGDLKIVKSQLLPAGQRKLKHFRCTQ